MTDIFLTQGKHLLILLELINNLEALSIKIKLKIQFQKLNIQN